MSKNKKLIPELRFPEFKNDGDWKEKTLGELGEFMGGGTPSKENQSYWNGNIPWISSSDITDDDIHNISITRYITEEAIKESATKPIPKNSVLFVSRVGVGKLAINKVDLCTSQDFTSFIPKDDISNYFIGYYFTTNKKLLQSLNQGTSIKGFSKSDLENFKLLLSPKHTEQQKIVSCLSSLDEVIEAHSQKLEVLKNHKKGLMQNLFPKEREKVPKLRFKEFEKDGDWVEKKLGEILIEGKLGGNYENTESNEGVPVIKMGNVDRGKINLDKIQYLPQNNSYNDNDVLKKGDLLFNTRNALELVGKVAIWRNELSFALYNSNLMRMTFDEKHIASNFFMNYVFNTELGLKKFKSIATGTTSVAAIYTKDLRTVVVSFPSKPEQQKIASCLSSLDELITAQAEKIEQLKLHKKGLMQGLFPKMND